MRRVTSRTINQIGKVITDNQHTSDTLLVRISRLLLASLIWKECDVTIKCATFSGSLTSSQFFRLLSLLSCPIVLHLIHIYNVMLCQEFQCSGGVIKSRNIKIYFIFSYFTVICHTDQHHDTLTAPDGLIKIPTLNILFSGKSPRALQFKWPIPSLLSHWPVLSHCPV